MNNKHTPEPWVVDPSAQYADRIMGTEAIANGVHAWSWVGTTNGTGGAKQANASRIVACVNACAGIENPEAVPDMLEALRHALTVLEYLASNGKPIDPRTIDEARAAIAKATSRSSDDLGAKP